jgi:hypothetical protein
VDAEDDLMSAMIKGALIGAMLFVPSSLVSARPMNRPPAAACVAIQTTCLPWQAPIGHRQVRAADVPDKFTPTRSDLELEALDKALDPKLSICRGC